jgi:hypothetical protein
MTAKDEAAFLGHLKYEIDALYALTEIIQSKGYKEPPIDSFLLECCLLHFRVVWDFFYGKPTPKDLTIRVFLSVESLKKHRPRQPKRLREIRNQINITIAHLGRDRIKPERKSTEPRMEDIALIREHTEQLFVAFTAALSEAQKAGLVNPLAHKFRNFKTV